MFFKTNSFLFIIPHSFFYTVSFRGRWKIRVLELTKDSLRNKSMTTYQLEFAKFVSVPCLQMTHAQVKIAKPLLSPKTFRSRRSVEPVRMKVMGRPIRTLLIPRRVPRKQVSPHLFLYSRESLTVLI